MTGASPHWIGWRFWLAGPCEVDGTTRPVLANPLNTGQGNGRPEDLWVDGSPRTATCRATTHTAPDPACKCGYRIVRRLTDLVTFVGDFGHMHTRPQPANGEGTAVRLLRRLYDHRRAEVATWVAFGQVEGTGRAIGGVLDPRDTVRVERIRLIGPLLLSPSIADYAREFERYYPVTAYPGRGDYWKWLDGISISRRPKIADPDDWPDPTTTQTDTFRRPDDWPDPFRRPEPAGRRPLGREPHPGGSNYPMDLAAPIMRAPSSPFRVICPEGGPDGR